MEQDRDDPDGWIEHAVEQAIALHGTVRDQPHLRALVELILRELATEIVRRMRADEG